jgi:hypothetical protein
MFVFVVIAAALLYRVNAMDDDGQKALIMATKEGRHMVVELLKAHGAIADHSLNGLTLEKLRNAEYISIFYGDPVEDVRAGGNNFQPSGNKPVRLKDGYHETEYSDSETIAFIKLTGKIAFGDLNGDGAQDAAVILLSSGGGSGGFFELAVMINQNGTPVQAASQSLGDRADVKSIAIRSGIIVIDILLHGPGDARCCPSIRQIQRYRLDGGRLVQLDEVEHSRH